jgi:ABC-type sugar transport system ATPase subunit
VTPFLEVRQLSARYGRVEALHDISLSVADGEFVAVLGPNGAGKSTLMRAIMGLIANSGDVSFRGAALPRQSPDTCVARGMVLVPEGRGIFAPMTVAENLELGAYLLNDRAEFERPPCAGVQPVSPRCASGSARLRAPCRAASNRCWLSACANGRSEDSAAGRAVAGACTEGHRRNPEHARAPQQARSAYCSGRTEGATGASTVQPCLSFFQSAGWSPRSIRERSNPMTNSPAIISRDRMRRGLAALPWVVAGAMLAYAFIAGGYFVPSCRSR